MEYFEERDLSTFITEAKTLERDARDIAENLLQALVMIHSQGFTHRDLKPQVSGPFSEYPLLHDFPYLSDDKLTRAEHIRSPNVSKILGETR